MGIEVEGPGGVIVEFPDGTPKATIEAAMRAKYPPRKSQTGLGFVDRANDKRVQDYQAGKARAANARANPAQLGSRVAGDLWAPVDNALSAIGEGYQQFVNAPDVNPFTAEGQRAVSQRNAGTNKALGGAANLALSPITGPMNALFGAMGRGAEQLGIGNEQDNKNALFLATSAARPVPGMAPRVPAPPRVQPTPAATTLARRGRINPAEAQARVADMRAAGVEPNLTAVVGERGQRVVRAVGARNATAGETLTSRARQSAATAKPAVMDRTRQMVNDPRSAAQMADEATTYRAQNASLNYDQAYNQALTLDAATLEALGSETGQTALRLARRSAADLPDGAPVLQEIDAILTGNATEASGRTLDYVRQVMGDMQRGFQARPEMARRAVGVGARRDQLDATLNAAPGIQQARAQFHEESRAIDILRGERGARRDFSSTAPADYDAWFSGLPAQAQQAERAAIRQDILDTLGGQRSNTFGSIDELASSQYSGANLRTAFGQQEADNYIANLNARMAQTRADQVVAPGAGSRTAVLNEDMEQLGNIAGTVANVARGRFGTALTDWWRRRGIPDDVAIQITEMASDPAQLDAALAQIEAAMGPGSARQFLDFIRRPEVASPALQSSAAYQGQ